METASRPSESMSWMADERIRSRLSFSLISEECAMVSCLARVDTLQRMLIMPDGVSIQRQSQESTKMAIGTKSGGKYEAESRISSSVEQQPPLENTRNLGGRDYDDGND